MSIFDNIRRIDPDGAEYWSSRDLAKALEYSDYRNFEEVMTKARIACKNSRQPEEDHFVDVTEMIELPKGAQRQITSVFLSRYACYLIVQNADPRKEIVALGHSYFAMQTRRQELEDDRRLHLRQETEEIQMIESRCGLLCGVCEYREQMNCGGCIAIAKPFWGDDGRRIEQCRTWASASLKS